MKKKALATILSMAMVLTLVSCKADKGTDKENVQGESQNQITEENGDASEGHIILKSYEEYKSFASDNMKTFKELYDKNGVAYKLSADGSIIMNTETTVSSLGKEYHNYFSVSIGADTYNKTSKIINSTFISNNIQDKYSKDNKNIALAYDLITNTSNEYNSIDDFVDELNSTVESMTSDSQKVELRNSGDIEIYLEKDGNTVELFILSTKLNEVQYGTVDDVEFDTYDEYKLLMRTTNAEIDAKEISIDGTGVHLGSGVEEENGVEILDMPNTYSIGEDTFQYGIFNAQNLDMGSGDFTIEFKMNFDGEIKNLDRPVEGFTKLLKDKVNIEINPEDFKNYIITTVELEEFIMGRYGSDSNRDEVLVRAYDGYVRYLSNGKPFDGMIKSIGFEHDSKININIEFEIPVTVEGKTAR
ncbi:hypothetical protein [Clostridium sp.]|uniref:hypothetical protein n=1 Tax=Clostridium sp. TaxID=1506 RepID=UPI001D4DB4EE|nr:hypothetical protein [Clostridium sp.]MBS5939711.1 hypothetical protein [Clostridium sp.]